MAGRGKPITWLKKTHFFTSIFHLRCCVFIWPTFPRPLSYSSATEIAPNFFSNFRCIFVSHLVCIEKIFWRINSHILVALLPLCKDLYSPSGENKKFVGADSSTKYLSLSAPATTTTAAQTEAVDICHLQVWRNFFSTIFTTMNFQQWRLLQFWDHGA